ncbi:MAG: hypothetical protein LQ347_004413 [Umbilicaria vellea]|nr:MAG: hypothetical protein LQ347_004413 [Umbilicaria vellea]
MAEAPNPGLLDLEKELTCSICTDILYQPLTLLDCLHTFCGSCLKEWFSWQASQAQSTSSSPYTCPSCRASVRETRPDAKVTTLLDMYLQANPSRGRTVAEKEEIKEKYKPGDSVMPKVKMERETSEDEADRRVLEEVRELSLRDVQVQSGGSYESRVRHGGRPRGQDTRDEEARQRRRPEEARRRRHEGSVALGGDNGSAMGDVDRRSQARQIEHQSSLRSLLSGSEGSSAEMQEEILRQIMDEGLLDGIDLNNMNVAQEDELSERIADAYRVFQAARRDRTKVNHGTGTRQELQVQQIRDRICPIRQSRGHTYSKHTLPVQVIGGERQVGTGTHPLRSREDLVVGHRPISNDKELVQRRI